jgi:hypothetical protein
MVFRYWDHSADQHDIAGKFVTFPRKGLRACAKITLHF